MTARRKPSAVEAFAWNMEDAHALVRLAEALVNRRTRRMRKELRDRVGDALGIGKRKWDQIDGIKSDDLFVTFLPGSRVCREDFLDLSPLLRQAIVAGCAATETYLADKALERLTPVLWDGNDPPKQLATIPLTVSDWIGIEGEYTYRRRGLRERVIAPYVREHSSTAPSKVGELLAMMELPDWSKKIDGQRKVTKGTTVDELQRITNRRNKIAHEGDRRGRGRATITIDEVKCDLQILDDVVSAIEHYLPSA